MNNYSQHHDNKSRTPDSAPSASKQAPLSEILQMYKNKESGNHGYAEQKDSPAPDNLETVQKKTDNISKTSVTQREGTAINNIADTGIISSLLYEPFTQKTQIGMGPAKKEVPYLGADIILLFDPLATFGKNGDRLTFVQTVSDNIAYKIEADDRLVYTWKANTTSSFDKRNPGTDGSLGQVIDQQMTANKDFRYTESRNTPTDQFSTREKKVNALITILSKIPSQRDEDEKEIVKSLTDSGLKPTDNKNDVIPALLESKPIKYVTYGTQKKFGKWLSAARMCDSPRINPKTNYKPGSLEGGQNFETVIYYEPAEGTPQILGTVKWGWIIENEEAKLLPLAFEQNASAGFRTAMVKWDAMDIGQMPFPAAIADHSTPNIRA